MEKVTLSANSNTLDLIFRLLLARGLSNHMNVQLKILDKFFHFKCLDGKTFNVMNKILNGIIFVWLQDDPMYDWYVKESVFSKLVSSFCSNGADMYVCTENEMSRFVKCESLLDNITKHYKIIHSGFIGKLLDELLNSSQMYTAYIKTFQIQNSACRRQGTPEYDRSLHFRKQLFVVNQEIDIYDHVFSASEWNLIIKFVVLVKLFGAKAEDCSVKKLLSPTPSLRISITRRFLYRLDGKVLLSRHYIIYIMIIIYIFNRETLLRFYKANF